MFEREILDLFKCMVSDKTGATNTSLVAQGLVLDFTPTKNQIDVLRDAFKPLNVRTMFSREERDNADPFYLITKQLLHYLEVYGMGQPGFFDLEVSDGVVFTMTYVRGVTVTELGDLVRALIYRNAPVADAIALRNIIQHYKIDYDLDRIANNELRVALFDESRDWFKSGDDAVRYICYVATGNMMLIKSREVVKAVSDAADKISAKFLDLHEVQLGQVFNRHKRLIMALKGGDRRAVINRISRRSKTVHVPLQEAINKTFVARALANTISLDVLDKISVRDKFKYLNLLAYKRNQHRVDAFIVRNGKIHLEDNRPVWASADIDRVEEAVLDSLARDLAHLKGKTVLLDKQVRYGLPTSRKQTVGQLPFGTRVKVEDAPISSGIYWESDWGANDLDLSTIDQNGQRTGWGGWSGYDRSNPITFSGDMTYAGPNGAMEFMTSKGQDYGLFVNIFRGEPGTQMEVIVGPSGNDKKWIDAPIIREKTKLASRGMVIGFVRGNEFVVWQGRIGNRTVSGSGLTPYVARGMSEFWTVNDLFDHLGVKYVVDKNTDVVYDYDVSYSGVSFDKLEEMLYPQG